MSASPNIVYIFADDLGYGDISCLNQRGKISTPNVDRLASEGMVFTDAHSTSSICSPSRYGVLTGRYNWRTRMQNGIVGVYGNPLISADRLTVGGLLQGSGYHTACIGKWHLGWNWPLEKSDYFSLDRNADPATYNVSDEATTAWHQAFSQPIADGPISRGFNTYFGVDVPNWPPYVFIEDDRTIGIPSEYLPHHLITHNRLASLPGPAMKDWKLEEILPALGDRACDYIRKQGTTGEPFFLYMPLTSPHTPHAVNDEWKGKSGLTLYADFVMETDAVVGRVLDALTESGVVDNTLVIFTSDNGCAPPEVADLEAMGHFPSAQYRGYKSDIWDGGHRLPFVARWPGVVAPGSTSAQTICHADLLATCAEVVGATLPDGAGEDSVSILSLLRGETAPVREHVINHSGPGKFAIRKGKWKLVLCGGSGGWAAPTDEKALELGLPSVQLYNLADDPGEKDNLQAERPDKVKELASLLEKLVNDGRSTPGSRQSNDANVDIWKGSDIGLNEADACDA